VDAWRFTAPDLSLRSGRHKYEYLRVGGKSKKTILGGQNNNFKQKNNMKIIFKVFFVTLSLTLTANIIFAQDSREPEIRQLENIEREAVLKGDSLTLFKLWSPNMVIHNPANIVMTVVGTKMLLRTGKLNYISFERTIEKITFDDNLAIVMGEEKLKPQGLSSNAGKLVTRRFTNIWKFSNNSWSIIARQATIIKVE
jgi:hypothetical protein